MYLSYFDVAMVPYTCNTNLTLQACLSNFVVDLQTVPLFLSDSSLRERKQQDKEERLSLVIWKRPVQTIQYSFLETLITFKEWTLK